MDNLFMQLETNNARREILIRVWIALSGWQFEIQNTPDAPNSLMLMKVLYDVKKEVINLI